MAHHCMARISQVMRSCSKAPAMVEAWRDLWPHRLPHRLIWCALLFPTPHPHPHQHPPLSLPPLHTLLPSSPQHAHRPSHQRSPQRQPRDVSHPNTTAHVAPGHTWEEAARRSRSWVPRVCSPRPALASVCHIRPRSRRHHRRVGVPHPATLAADRLCSVCHTRPLCVGVPCTPQPPHSLSSPSPPHPLPLLSATRPPHRTSAASKGSPARQPPQHHGSRRTRPYMGGSAARLLSLASPRVRVPHPATLASAPPPRWCATPGHPRSGPPLLSVPHPATMRWRALHAPAPLSSFSHFFLPHTLKCNSTCLFIIRY